VHTVKILNLLDKNKKNSHATFHFNPKLVKDMEEDAKKIVRRAFFAGHTVGVRWNPVFDNELKEMNEAEFTERLKKDRQAISDAIGKVGGKKVLPMFVRLPYGKYSSKHVKWAEKAGVTITTSTVEANDYSNSKSSKRIVEYFTDAFDEKRKAGYISGLHDIYTPTFNAFPDILKAAHLKGLKVVTLDECLTGKAPMALAAEDVEEVVVSDEEADKLIKKAKGDGATIKTGVKKGTLAADDGEEAEEGEGEEGAEKEDDDDSAVISGTFSLTAILVTVVAAVALSL